MLSPKQQRLVPSPRRGLGAGILALALLFALPAAAQADWGAIAVDTETGKTGIAYDYATAATAKGHARDECGGAKCLVAVWVRNGFAALVQKRSGAFVAGAGATRRLAFRAALRRAHEGDARRVVWVFSG